MDKTRKEKQPTLTTISELSGYSVSTVSRALSGSPRISQSTRKEILHYARQCSYQTKKRLIAIVTHGYINYFSFMLMALQSELIKHDFQVIIISEQMLELLEEIPIQGAVSLLSENGLEQIWGAKYPFPLVCINTKSNRLSGLFSITSNDEKAVSNAVESLYQQGHRRIGAIGIEYFASNQNAVRRELTFKKLATQLNFTAFSESIMNDNDSTVSAIQYLLDQKITALICTSEIAAPQVVQSLQWLKVKIPEDLSVIVWALGKYEAWPKDFEIYSQNYSKIAQAAVQMIESLCNGEAPPQSEMQIDYLVRHGHSIRPVTP